MLSNFCITDNFHGFTCIHSVSQSQEKRCTLNTIILQEYKMGEMQENFRKFLLNWKSVNWVENQTSLAEHLGVSRQQLSNILNGHRGGSEQARMKICKKLGVDYRDLVELPSDGSATPPPKKPTQSNVLQFNGIGHLAIVTDPKTEKMHRDLDTILQSGDDELIDAIRLNLMSFRKKVELQKQIEEQGKRIAVLEASIK